MTSILSAISGQFSKSLILGTFLPVTVFVILSLIIVVPLFPADWSLLRPLESLDTQWQVIAVSFLTIVLSGLLYSLNIPIIRFYEGYPWKDSTIGKWRTRHYQAQFKAAQARLQGMRTLLRALRKDKRYAGSYGKILDEWNRIGRTVHNEFPRNEASVLPTRLGNVIRSFEHYPYLQYGIAAITVWPRLIAKIDKDHAAATDDVKASFDFMINSSLLSAVLALAILLVGLLYPAPFASLRLLLPWLIEVIACVALATWFYLLSIGRASAWGAMVKGAFDLYRWDLLEQLGYKQVPTTKEEERTLWNNISLQMIYGDQPTGPRADYAVTESPTFVTSARGEPDAVGLQTAREVSTSDAGGAIKIIVRVKNVDVQKRTAKNVIVTDRLPDDFNYERGSARVDGYHVRVKGTNPYRFHLVGDLGSCAEVCLTYRAIPRKPIRAALQHGLKRIIRSIA